MNLGDYVRPCQWPHGTDHVSNHHVYLLLGVGDVPLYVGRTIHLAGRISTHRRCRSWWPQVVDLVSVRACCVDGASQAELRAMRDLLPTFNVDPREGSRRGHNTRARRAVESVAS